MGCLSKGTFIDRELLYRHVDLYKKKGGGEGGGVIDGLLSLGHFVKDIQCISTIGARS